MKTLDSIVAWIPDYKRRGQACGNDRERQNSAGFRPRTPRGLFCGVWAPHDELPSTGSGCQGVGHDLRRDVLVGKDSHLMKFHVVGLTSRYTSFL